MGLFDSLNGTNGVIMNGVETEGMDFVKLKEFVGQKINVKGFFFTTGGKYGKSVVVITDSVLVNMPNWSVPKFEKIQDNDAMRECVLAGKCAIDNIAILPTNKGNDTVKFDIVEVE